MKVEARVSESGQSVHAANDRDWAFVHPPPGRPRPILFCPERSCDNRVTAVEKPDATGQMTRFFRFVPRGATCTHAEVVNPVVAAQPNSAPPTGETAEHRWLKLYVRDVAERAGYQGVVVEQTLNDRVRADVFVPGATRGRVEVQRAATDVPERTADYREVVWLLRAAFDDSNTRYLFTYPCVQIRVVRYDGLRWVVAEPWNGDSGERVRATSTVLRIRAEPDSDDPFGFFETDKRVLLADFLLDVWSGRRRWYPKGPYKFAGWITVEDFERYEEWKQTPAQQPTAHTPSAAEPEPTDVTAEPSVMARDDVGGPGPAADDDRMLPNPTADSATTQGAPPSAPQDLAAHAPVAQSQPPRSGLRWLLLGAAVLATAAVFAVAVAVTGFLACGVSGCGGGGFGPAYAPLQAQVGLLVAGLTLLPLALLLLRRMRAAVKALAAVATLVLGATLAMLVLGLGPDGCPWGQTQATAGPGAFQPGSRTCSADPHAVPRR